MGGQRGAPVSTLVGSERRLAPLSWGACLGSLALSAALLARAWDCAGSAPARARVALAVCALATLLPHAWNLASLVSNRGKASFGMVPVALISLAPAGLARLMTGGGGRAWDIVGIASVVLGMATGLLLAAGSAIMRAAYGARPQMDGARAAVVLGAGVREGRPGRTLELRLERALELWRAHPGLLLVCTGGTGEGGESEAGVMVAWLGERGVPPMSLLEEGQAANTRQNLGLSVALLRRRGMAAGEPVCVVSSGYHLFRALREARGLGVEAVGVPAGTPLASLPQQWARELLTLAFGR